MLPSARRVPHHELIPRYGNTGGTTNKQYKNPSGQLSIFVQRSHSTPNQRKQPPKHISGGLNESVRGWVAAGGAGRVILFLLPTTSDFS